MTDGGLVLYSNEEDVYKRQKLKSELDDLQRLVDRIPPDILAELKRQQRHTRER